MKDEKGNSKTTGILNSFAYQVLDFFELNSVKIIRLKLPWGTAEYTGKWGPKSLELQLRENLN